MASTRVQRARTKLRVSAPWRQAMPHRTVLRHVQGVDLFMPWCHHLPDFARAAPHYGQNLVELAAALGEREDGPLRVLDVGANIGDSALQIARRTDAEVLCIEGDPYWARYLHLNVDDASDIHVVEALLTAEETGGLTPVRTAGTTRFVADATAGTAALPVGQLREQEPAFAQLRLVKSDTDGHDARLVPAIAATWADVGPVLFFEWDPGLNRRTDGQDPDRLWGQLADLGYAHVAIWDNGGDPIGRCTLAEARQRSEHLEREAGQAGHTFWDVAVCRGDDAAGLAALDDVLPG